MNKTIGEKLDIEGVQHKEKIGRGRVEQAEKTWNHSHSQGASKSKLDEILQALTNSSPHKDIQHYMDHEFNSSGSRAVAYWLRAFEKIGRDLNEAFIDLLRGGYHFMFKTGSKNKADSEITDALQPAPENK